jgi:hypothetical protein
MKKLIIIALVILSGCYYDNEEELYPGGGGDCDTVNVTYSGTVLPIISDNCKTCHSGGAPQGNVLLEDYASISAAGKITAGQYGSLYGVISHHPDNSPMPKNGTQLSDCKIKQIKAWIDAGTPNN